MWRPLFRRSNESWIGADEQAGIWVGTRQKAQGLVEFDRPLFLWPLLERPFPEVQAELVAHWGEFAITSFTSEQLLESVVVHAIRRARPYWCELALTWLEVGMTFGSDAGRAGVVDALVEIDTRLPQNLRHRAERLAFRLRDTSC